MHARTTDMCVVLPVFFFFLLREGGGDCSKEKKKMLPNPISTCPLLMNMSSCFAVLVFFFFHLRGQQPAITRRTGACVCLHVRFFFYLFNFFLFFFLVVVVCGHVLERK